MNAIERVVFDCNVYFQAAISLHGPAAKCFAAAQEGKLLLFVSQQVIDEFRDVCLRPTLARRFALTEERVDAWISAIKTVAVCWESVPHVFDLQRDPEDAHYIDLAAACHAKLIVSRDRDLLALNDPLNPEAVAFRKRFPEISILRVCPNTCIEFSGRF
ncbi:MAG: putative toxin-antitoxin system toxin component, PIN family [Planctomycetes bacterium]|nr:putative toxin-antitoxin system toxin component, PIN family [Planctomycetota bacterium]